MMSKNKEPIEIICPKCRRTAIVFIPEESVPSCPDCKVQMVFQELMKEGKSY